MREGIIYFHHILKFSRNMVLLPLSSVTYNRTVPHLVDNRGQKYLTMLETAKIVHDP